MRTLLFIVLMIAAWSCRKDEFTTSGSALLRTSVDTLHFDTVFTSTGSVTQLVKIVNDNNKGIRIGSVKLAGGAASPFRINVDGIAGPEVRNVEIAANDSAYVFVTVTINPNSSNLPFIVRDSIEISYNGNRRFIQLDALGRNAKFLRNYTVTSSETWNNDLPYVLLGQFTINENATLTINKGSRIYLHADAPLVVRGTLKVEGEHWDSTRVVFTGDRLDVPYRDFPASWPGIYFTATSKDNSFRFANILNAYQAIVVQDPSTNGNPKVEISETIIDNAYDAGILAVNSRIRARNLLVSNCGRNLVLARGGNYEFVHSTIATYSNSFIQHREPVMVLANYINQGNTSSSADLNALFRNCIFWGEQGGLVDNEVVVLKNGNTAFQVTFDHVLWRVQSQPANATITNAINQDPLFDTINTAERTYSFRLKAGSPAVNKGTATGIPIDLDGNSRPVGLPDLGAYEHR
jgi:hypothetical protein